MIKPVFVEAIDIQDLWFQSLRKILEEGREFIVDRGSYEGQTRLEFDFFIGLVKRPGSGGLLPEIPDHFKIPNPVDRDYIFGGPDYDRSYIEYLMSARKEPGEAYTYGERLVKAELLGNILELWQSDSHIVRYPDLKDRSVVFKKDGRPILNQIEWVINQFKNHGHRNNQLVLQVAQPSDLVLVDPPCLRHIDCRIQDNRLIFFIYFRSWDLWGGLPANLAGIQQLKEYMAAEIGVDDGEMLVQSKGLHLYGYATELAKIRCYVEDC